MVFSSMRLDQRLGILLALCVLTVTVIAMTFIVKGTSKTLGFFSDMYGRQTENLFKENSALLEEMSNDTRKNAKQADSLMKKASETIDYRISR